MAFYCCIAVRLSIFELMSIEFVATAYKHHIQIRLPMYWCVYYTISIVFSFLFRFIQTPENKSWFRNNKKSTHKIIQFDSLSRLFVYWSWQSTQYWPYRKFIRICCRCCISNSTFFRCFVFHLVLKDLFFWFIQTNTIKTIKY